MQNIKSVLALALVAGFASTSFAQGSAAPTTGTAPAAKVTASTAAPEKKVEAPKAAEPAKAEVGKTAEPAADAAKPVKHQHKVKKVEKTGEKAEAAPAPLAK